MIQGVVEKLLVKYLGGIFNGIDKSIIQLGAWKGDLRIENLELRPEIFEDKDFPFSLISSSVGLVSIKVPWSKIASQPVEIFVYNMKITGGLLSENNWHFKDYSKLETRMETLKDYAEGFLNIMRRNLKE